MKDGLAFFDNHFQQEGHVSLDAAAIQHLEIKKLEEEIKTLKIRMQSQLNVLRRYKKKEREKSNRRCTIGRSRN